MGSDPAARGYALAEDVMIEKLGDATIVVNLATDEVHELNETAARLLELLREGKTAAEAAEALARAYDAELATVREDVARTIEVFLAEKVLVPRPA